MSTVRITIEPTAPGEFVALAGRLRFVRGAARYRRADLGAQLQRFAQPTFVVARERDAVLGGCVLDRRRLSLDGRPVDGLYRALLGVRAERGGEGIGRAIVAAAFEQADRLADERQTPVLSYGCVDAANAASLALLRRHGAQPCGALATALLYRQWPRAQPGLQRADDAVRADAARLVALGEADCGWRDTVDAGSPGWVWQDERGPAIVANVALSTLSFDTLGALNDRLVAALVEPFGFARKRFDRSAFRYVRLSAVGVRPGAEADWRRFLDSLLHAHGCHYAMLVIDPTRQLARRIGLHRSTASLQVMARWHGSASRPPAAAPGPTGLHPVDV